MGRPRSRGIRLKPNAIIEGNEIRERRRNLLVAVVTLLVTGCLMVWLVGTNVTESRRRLGIHLGGKTQKKLREKEGYHFIGLFKKYNAVRNKLSFGISKANKNRYCFMKWDKET